MLALEKQVAGGSALKAFAAFALLVLSAGNNFLWSLKSPPLPQVVVTHPHSESRATLPIIIPRKEEEEPTTKEEPTLTKLPVLFLHFHKSSGTSACAALKSVMNVTDANGKPIRLRGEVEHNLMANCNTPFSGPNANVKLFGSLQTCRHLLPYAVDVEYKPRSNNVVAVEIPFKDSMPCPGFRSFAIMRDPVTRLQSHMLAHRNWNEAKIKGYIRNRTPAPEHYYMDGYPIVNNMVIRQLLGRSRFIDTEPINGEDLEQAKKLVDQFDAFVPMEHLFHPNVQQLLNTTIPEYVQAQQKQRKRLLNKRKNANSYQPSENFVRLIRDENKYDIQLYKYMLEKLGLRK